MIDAWREGRCCNPPRREARVSELGSDPVGLCQGWMEVGATGREGERFVAGVSERPGTPLREIRFGVRMGAVLRISID